MSLLEPPQDSEEELHKKLSYLKQLKEQLQEKEAGLTDLDREIRAECEESLSSFVKYAWKYMDPSEYIHGWHIDAVCDHLQAVAQGDIRHLLINQPPRTSKSLTFSVAFPAWVWALPGEGPLIGADKSFLFASYAQNLSFRDSLKCRRLIMSPWYQKLWGLRFHLMEETKGRFTNNKGGQRIATSVGGQLTGEGGNYIGIDDAHNSVEIESDAVRQGVLEWWDQSMSTRHNSPKTDAFIVVMQRLHQDDLAGHILDRMDGDWTHLMIPMRYDPDRHCATTIGFTDPRVTEGELLWPKRLGEKEVKSLESRLGPYGTAGQLQQAPAPKGGGIIKEDWWQPWIDKYYPPMEYIIASADTAYTEKEENDYSACTVLGVYRDTYDLPKIMVMAAWQERLGLNALVHKLAHTCKKFKVDRLVVENKASGISVTQEIRRLFGNEIFGVLLLEPKGDKFARLVSVEPLFAEKIVFVPYIQDEETGAIVPREWVDMLIKQVTQFPKGKWKDLVDTISQGVKHLRDNGLIVRREERDLDLERQQEHQPPKEPLYDC